MVEPQEISSVLEKVKTQIHAIASETFINYNKFCIFTPGTVSSTVLLVGRSRYRIPVASVTGIFLVDTDRTMCPGVNSASKKMSTRDSPGGKGGRCLRLTTYRPFSAERQEIRGFNLPGLPWVISTTCFGRDLYIYSIKEAIGLRLDALKGAVQDRKKWRMLVEEKTRNWERTNVKLTEENDNGIPLLDNIL